MDTVKQLGRYAWAQMPRSVRYGRFYLKMFEFLQRSQYWNKQQIEDYQKIQLRNLLDHAYLNVPYYRQVFDERGIRPEHIKRLEDLKELPFLTKDIIRNNIEQLKARNFKRRRFRRENTGGSTGTPMEFFHDRLCSDSVEAAFIFSMFSRAGFTRDDMRMSFRGSVIHRKSDMEFNPSSREIICSVYHFDHNHLQQYYEAMVSKGVKYIHGYPSAVAQFGSWLLRNGLFYPLMMVFCGSEKVFPFQRDIIKQAFGARVFSWYGHTERVVLAGECECSQHYHIFPEYGITELINDSGVRIMEKLTPGEIVGTSFHNYAMPFIRYRTGDIALYTEGKCKCNREYDLISDIEGRKFEYVVTADGKIITLTALIFGQHLKAFRHIHQLQLYQDNPGNVEFRIVKLPSYDKSDERDILEKIGIATGGNLAVTFSYLDRIEKTASGKQQFLIQKLHINPNGDRFNPQESLHVECSIKKSAQS